MHVPANERGNLAVLCLEAGLTRMQSAVLMAHYGDGYSRAEVAAKLGISKHTVDVHLAGAGKRLREEAHRAEIREQIHEKVTELRRSVSLTRAASAPRNEQLTSGAVSN